MSAAKKIEDNSHEHALRIQGEILQIQSQFMGKIQAAQAQQDWPAVQKLSLDMQHAIAATIAGLNPPEEESAEAMREASSEEAIRIVTGFRFPGCEATREFYDQSLTKINLDLCAYDGDRNILKNLIDDRSFFRPADQILKNSSPFKSRKELMKDALKLTPLMAPKLHQILKGCVEKLGLSTGVELFVRQDTFFNAACYPPDGGGLQLCLTSSLVENFSDAEIAFVLGHELGHFLFGHHRVPAGYLLHHGSSEFSPIHAMKLHAWKRNAEISADRMGLICCDDFEVAGKTFFKLSSGITDARFEFAMSDYIKQFSDLKSELEKEGGTHEDFFTTHPFAPLRLKALDIFWQSETYNRLTNKDRSFQVSEAQMENEIKAFMSFMEPSYLFETSDTTQLCREFLFMAGFCVAAANGKVEDSELAYLGSLVDEETFGRCLALFDIKSPKQIREDVAELAVKVHRAVRPTDRLSILKDLCLVALSDGSVEDSEVQALMYFADILHIKGDFIVDTLNALLRESKQAA